MNIFKVRISEKRSTVLHAIKTAFFAPEFRNQLIAYNQLYTYRKIISCSAVFV